MTTPKKREWRLNVAAVVTVSNQPGKILACLRNDVQSWQCVQGGVEPNDPTFEAAIERELREELGITHRAQVVVRFRSQVWRRYTFPDDIKSLNNKGRLNSYAGQDQLWFWIEIPFFEVIDLSMTDGEFAQCELLSVEMLANKYAGWKRPAFIDFCQECGLWPTGD